jgi:HlyD family secretion protein
MKPSPRIAVAIVALGLLGFLVWKAAAKRPEDAHVLSGYVEGEALYLAAPAAGTVTALNVARGQRVAEGAPLFAVDPTSQTARRAGAAATVAEARARLASAQAAVSRQAAALRAAEADAANARRDADRYGRLSGTGAVSVQETDRARTTAAEAQARRAQAAEALASARAEAEAARAAIAQAGAAEADNAAQLAQLSRRAPAAGRIEETFFQRGEWAPANQPILSLIPDNQVRLRFYVPERDLSLYRLGRPLSFTCDGCGAAREARIVYVSPRPEFTPPVIYSRKARDRMVFLVEARPVEGTSLSPGQPIDVASLGPR